MNIIIKKKDRYYIKIDTYPSNIKIDVGIINIKIDVRILQNYVG